MATILKSIVVVLCLVGGVRVARADCVTVQADALAVAANSSATLTSTEIERRQCLGEAFRAEFQSASEIVATLFQTLGQVVIDRATSAAWGILQSKLSGAASCDKSPHFPKVCEVLKDLRLQDVVASPRILLDAAIEDLYTKIRAKLDTLANDTALCVDVAGEQVCAAKVLVGFVDAWTAGGKDAAFDYLRNELTVTVVRVTATAAQCPDTQVLCRAVRAVGLCALAANSLRDLNECEILDQVTKGPDDVVVRRWAVTVSDAIRSGDVGSEALVRLFAQAIRDALKCSTAPETDGCDLVDAFEEVLLGLRAEDWTRVAGGAVQALDAIGKRGEAKFFKFVAAVGQYAGTYVDTKLTPEEATAVRKKVIGSLIDSMTDRSQRESGVVISLGGQFGMQYSKRYEPTSDGADPTAFGTPLHLSLGLGVETYCRPAIGFHGMISVVDLSQYVAFEDKDFTVGTPDPKAALAFGATVGVWGFQKQTPLFVALQFTYSPFVDISPEDASAKGSYQVGLMAGAYVPILDFN